MITEKQIDEFLFTTDRNKVDLEYVHEFLSKKSYWAEGIPLDHVQQAIENSLCISILKNGYQAGFARVISDFTTFAYLADVFVDEQYRGRGLSKQLMQFILSLRETKYFRRFILATKDAHGLYNQFGFSVLDAPERFMEIRRPDYYKNLSKY